MIKGKKKGKAKKKGKKGKNGDSFTKLIKYKKVFKRAFMKYKIRTNIVHFRKEVARMIKLRKFKPRKKNLK